jgi:hypothetical protein
MGSQLPMCARGGFSVAGPALLVLAVIFLQIAPPSTLRAKRLRGKVTATDNDDARFLLALWRRLWPLAGLALALLVSCSQEAAFLIMDGPAPPPDSRAFLRHVFEGDDGE